LGQKKPNEKTVLPVFHKFHMAPWLPFGT